MNEHTYTNENTNRPPLVILTGPTAVGKTALSLKLARAIGGEIISADSMQVYRRMDIGSAKILPAEQEGIPHHLIDVLEPTQEFNAALFQELCNEAITRIRQAGHIPILAGGTGFYIQAVLRGIDFTEHEDPTTQIRQRLEEEASRLGAGALHKRLTQVDPDAAAQIHPNNVKRTIRALEYYEQTGQRISLHNETQKARENAFHAAYFVLTDDRARLYDRIDRRVDLMMEQGLVDEVKALRDEGVVLTDTSMQGLGYRQIMEYLQGDYDLEEAVYRIKRDTRHFAKRQLTWFRREPDVIWLDKQELTDDDQLLERILGVLRERGIIA